MKTALSFGLIVAAASTLFACSEDSGTGCRTNCGGSGNSTSNAGTSGAPSGGNTSTGGTSGAGTGGSTGGPDVRTGDALTISATGAVTDTARGISGQAFFAESPTVQVPTTFTAREGELCISGETAAVVDMDYTSAWGAELIIDLLRPTGGGAGDAGAGDAGDAGGGDAGGVIMDTDAWAYGDVIGFTYKISGKDPASLSLGVPDLGLRFKGLPEGSVGDTDTYCSSRCGGRLDPGVVCPTSDSVDAVLFSGITYNCWDAANPSLADEMIPRGSLQTLVPNPRKLQNISWQVNADPGITKAFNFCISDIRPILP